MRLHNTGSANSAGLFTLSLRWVIGWTYFSAFWRRLVLENKLIPDEAGYIGEKFNHFLPNALGIKPVIEYLVSNPDLLQISMISFTIIEAVLGLFLILGLYTRLVSIGIIMLATGILLGSGWLGTTCLDEWQIGVLGIAGGFTLFLSGSSDFSVDNYLYHKGVFKTKMDNLCRLDSIIMPRIYNRTFILISSIAIFSITLFTNQYFHGGVFGKLHNKSVKPKIEISNIRYHDDEVIFQLFRTEGADVYGSFLIKIEILDQYGNTVKIIDQEELSNLPENKIRNYYIAKIKSGKHSLVLPLGAKADLSIDTHGLVIEDNYSIKLTDISGIEWQEKINI